MFFVRLSKNSMRAIYESQILFIHLHEGSRFALLLETTGNKILGTLLRVGAGSATVKLDSRSSGRMTTRIDKKTGEPVNVELQTPQSIEHWSLATPVLPLDDNSKSGTISEAGTDFYLTMQG